MGGAKYGWEISTVVVVSIVSCITFIAAILLSIPIATFFAEVLFAVLQRPDLQQVQKIEPSLSVAVLIPAHNESGGIMPTLLDVTPQLGTSDCVLVVADNCTDDTAVVAESAGAQVVQRHDLSRIGKGYALDFGARHLEIKSPDIVIVVDADCRLSSGAIAQLANMAAASNRPVQALYLMKAPDQSPLNYQVAEFAWRVKNLVRPLGLARVGLPCQLMGTGMAFPWNVIRQVSLASGHIVEDLKLGLDAALMGRAPIFCPQAMVTSTFPTTQGAADRQRERWEHGHLELMFKTAPRLVFTALRRGDIQLLALAADLAVPPLSALASMTLMAVAVTGLSAYLGANSLPFLIAICAACAFLAALGMAWFSYGRDLLPARAFVHLAPYVAAKLGLYLRFLTGNRVTRWNRTDRT